MSDLPIASSILYLDDVQVTFDGFRALRGLSLCLEPGEMRAIIGPNGAGKTTMMDVITGKTRPDTDTILFAGTHDLTQLDETTIAQMGIGRKFQKPTVFDNHTVADNILLALAGPRSPLSALWGARNMPADERIDALLTQVRLIGHRERQAGALSHGQKQWLEIAMLLAQDPKLLLIDEPVAGIAGRLGLQKTCVAVENVRGGISKADMIHNNATPEISVDPETYEVQADGALLVCEPAHELPMAQRYFLF